MTILQEIQQLGALVGEIDALVNNGFHLIGSFNERAANIARRLGIVDLEVVPLALGSPPGQESAQRARAICGRLELHAELNGFA